MILFTAKLVSFRFARVPLKKNASLEGQIHPKHLLSCSCQDKNAARQKIPREKLIRGQPIQAVDEFAWHKWLRSEEA